MQIDLRDERRRRIGRVEVDPALRPTRVAVQPQEGLVRRLSRRARVSAGFSGRPNPDAGESKDAFLDWEAAVDDGGHLRRCVACGCHDLYRSKAFPQITALVVVLAFAGAVVGVIGLATTPVLIAMTVVLVLDVWLLLFSKKRLVCYRCGTSYHGLPIARYIRWWDRTIAERYPVRRLSEPSAAQAKESEAESTSAAPAPRQSSQTTSMFAD